MAIEIHTSAIEALKAELINGLPRVSTYRGQILDGASAFLAAYKADDALPQNGNLHDQLVEMVEERPFANFVESVLSARLIDEQDYQAGAEKENLIESGVFGDANEVSDWLISQFTSLPWEYSFAIEFPPDTLPLEAIDGASQQFGEDCHVAKSDFFVANHFPLSHPNPRRNARLETNAMRNARRDTGGLARLIDADPKWNDDRAFFIQKRAGFVNLYGTGSVVEQCAFTLQSFVGLGLALKLFSHRFRFDSQAIRADWKVHQAVDDNWEYFARFDLDGESHEVLRHLKSFQFPQNHDDEKRIPLLRSTVKKISDVFSSEHSKSIMLAAKWFFDSHKGSDQTLRYIRLMTTLEILLGEGADHSGASLGVILSNRLAYLIGKNHSERHEILKKFKKIYEVRSSILHRGQHKLKAKEQNLISGLESYCKRAIEAEVTSLLA